MRSARRAASRKAQRMADSTWFRRRRQCGSRFNRCCFFDSVHRGSWREVHQPMCFVVSKHFPDLSRVFPELGHETFDALPNMITFDHAGVIKAVTIGHALVSLAELDQPRREPRDRGLGSMTSHAPRRIVTVRPAKQASQQNSAGTPQVLRSSDSTRWPDVVGLRVGLGCSVMPRQVALIHSLSDTLARPEACWLTFCMEIGGCLERRRTTPVVSTSSTCAACRHHRSTV